MRIESFVVLMALSQISKTDIVKIGRKIILILVERKQSVAFIVDFCEVVGISAAGVWSSHSVIIFKLRNKLCDNILVTE